ncbi:PREDICTED: myomegalin-like [Hipposideros armiger]|uniref:Myomegalin-like n=1 Tax=Hipposideros armiger TaxID=186990 RepID=A0A8B7SDB9_HIPAR|nr:PREDICTED: myomegalin-like [Hipposideros armiger]
MKTTGSGSSCCRRRCCDCSCCCRASRLARHAPRGSGEAARAPQPSRQSPGLERRHPEPARSWAAAAEEEEAAAAAAPWMRDYFAEDDGEMVPRTSHAAAFLSDTKDRGPPAQSQTWRSGDKIPFGQARYLRAFEKPPQVQTQALRDFEKHLNDLKKENFSLKLRIYFLEERMQEKYEASREDIYKRNIELKVEVESLKRELQGKKQHLDQTWSMESRRIEELSQTLASQEKLVEQLSQEKQQLLQLLEEPASMEVQRPAAASGRRAQPAGRRTLRTRRLGWRERQLAETWQVPSAARAAVTQHPPEAFLRPRPPRGAGPTTLVPRARAPVLEEGAPLHGGDPSGLCHAGGRPPRRETERSPAPRRWIFHTASKLNLQVLLSHVLGKDVSRDGKAEFACSKCAFMLDRIYRFDTVIARIEALSIERLQKLLLEKDRLKFCIASMYRKNNEDSGAETKAPGSGTVDISGLPDVRYSALLQEDFAYSGFECWVENEDQVQEPHSCHASEGPANRPRRCRGCAALRVADSDYEAICKVPRKVARSISCAPSSRWSTSICTEEPALSEVGPPDLASAKGPPDGESMEEGTPGSSVESLDASVQASPPQQKDEDTERSPKEPVKCDCCSDEQAPPHMCNHKLELALSVIKGLDYKPIQSPRGSKLPIPVKSSPPGARPGPIMADGVSSGFLNRSLRPLYKTPVSYPLEISDLQELWDDLCEEYLPLRVQWSLTAKFGLSRDLDAVAELEKELSNAKEELELMAKKERESRAAAEKMVQALMERNSELQALRQYLGGKDAVVSQALISNQPAEVTSISPHLGEQTDQVIEGQNDTMAKLREMLHQSQLGQLHSSEGTSPAQQQVALLDLQSALFCSQLEIQKLQRLVRQKERQLADAKRCAQFVEAAAQEGEQQKEASWKHNQDLRKALQQLQGDLQRKSQQLRTLEAEKYSEIRAQEQHIQHLSHSLSHKEQLLQEFRELLQYRDTSDKTLEANEMLLEKLRQRIQDRDLALERAIDEKFSTLEEKEKELRQLHLAVRERDHDLERLRGILSSNEATMQSMESLLRAKGLEVEQLSATCQNLQWLKEEMETKFSHWQKEQESIIQQLQTSLHDRNKEVEDLSATLLCKLGPGQSEVAEELCQRLQRKERMLQDLLSDRNKQAVEHEMEIQGLLQSMGAREQESQVRTNPQTRGGSLSAFVLCTMELSALQSMVAVQEGELQVQAADMESLTRSVQIKEDLIKDLQMQLLDPEDIPAVERLTQEVLLLREKVASVESQGQEASGNRRQQVKKEGKGKLMPNSFSFRVACLISSERDRTLQVELEGAQVLRGRLEEVLGRSLERLSRLETLAAIGGAATGDDTEDASTEFTDSIEEEAALNSHQQLIKVALEKSLAAVETQNAPLPPPSPTGGEDNRGLQEEMLHLRAEIHQHLEEKRKAEGELRELKAQLEEAGFSSVAHIRNTMLSLCLENAELKEQMGEAMSDGGEIEEDKEKGEAMVAATGGLNEKSLRAELRKLQDKLKNACNIISLLKEQLVLSSKEGKSQLSPELLVHLAGEMDGLNTEPAGSPGEHHRQGLEGTTMRPRPRPRSLDLGAALAAADTRQCEEQDSLRETVPMEGLCSEQEYRGSTVASLPGKKPLESQLRKQEAFQAYGKSEDISVLHKDIKELKAQLQTANKIIQNLKSRVRSLSVTSDYSSSLERPRKLKSVGTLEGSSPHSVTDEDEGWLSDGTGAFYPPGLQAKKDLESLIHRVSQLEAQLPKTGLEGKLAEELRSASWPGKYDSLIQDQARELSYLRQKIREGRGICYLLTQHTKDAVKSFEDLLRSNDIDYYLGQSFREQLAQGSQLTDRLTSKLSTKDHKSEKDQAGLEPLALRLSRELQEKEKVIEVLQAKLDAQSLTPASSHALSDSRRSPSSSSFLSDELEACSDMDVASEYTHYEEKKGSPGHSDSIHHPSHSAVLSSKPSATSAPQGVKAEPSSNPSSLPAPQKHPQEASQAQPGLHFPTTPTLVSLPRAPLPSAPASFLPFGPAGPPLLGCCETSAVSLAEAQQELQMLQKQLGESISTVHPASPATLPSNHLEAKSSHYLHPAQPHSPPRGTLELGRVLEPRYLGSSGHWDMMRPQKGSISGELFSGSSVCQLNSKPTGADLLEEHLGEIRNLRQRLEESICINDRLREQLEHRLSSTARSSGPTSTFYGQGLESTPQLYNENRILREENRSLQAQLSHISREHSQETERLREALLTSRSRLQELEMELERQKVDRQQLLEDLKEKQQEILHFQEERLSLQEKDSRLQHKLALLQQQCEEKQQLFESLQAELQIYEALCGSSKKGLKAYTWDACHQVPLSSDLSHLVTEIRALRGQLEESIQVNNGLRLQLEQQLDDGAGKASLSPSSISHSFPAAPDPGHKQLIFQGSVASPPVRDVGMNPALVFPSSSAAPGPETAIFNKSPELGLDASPEMKNPPKLEGDATDGSFANKHGRHVIGHIDDYSALSQQIGEGQLLVKKIASLARSASSVPGLEAQGTEVPGSEGVHELRSSASALHHALEESASLLSMFWRAALPSSSGPALSGKAGESVKRELLELRTQLSKQDRLLQSTAERLKTANQQKECMEQFIFSQLTRTHDVLKKARTNLEKNTYKIASVKPYSCPSKGATQEAKPPQVLKTAGGVGLPALHAATYLLRRSRPYSLPAGGSRGAREVAWWGRDPFLLFCQGPPGPARSKRIVSRGPVTLLLTAPGAWRLVTAHRSPQQLS